MWSGQLLLKCSHWHLYGDFPWSRCPCVLALEGKWLAMGRGLPYPAYLWTSNIACRFIYDEWHQPPRLAIRIDPKGFQASVQGWDDLQYCGPPHCLKSIFLWDYQLQFIVIPSSLINMPTQNPFSQAEHPPLPQILLQLMIHLLTPLIVSNFLFSIQVTTWLMVGSVFPALTQSATVIHTGGRL